MRSVHRDRLPNIRRNMRGTSEPYRIENSIDGAKSSGRTVPPIGAGNRTIFALKWLINAGNVGTVYQPVVWKRERFNS